MPEPMPKITPRRVAPDVEMLTFFYPVPGLGLVPVNAFVLHAAQPVLVDTGLIALGPAYLEGIAAAIDLPDLRWIYLTHADPDHVGCLRDVLAAAPAARLVTTFLGLGKLGLTAPIPAERVYLLNPGQSLDVGDRTLGVLRPPIFDAPETTAFVDRRSGTLFSSDFCGAVLQVPAETAADVPAADLRDGMMLWATVDAPWLAAVDPTAFVTALAHVRALAPPVILSSHLPPALGIADRLLDHVLAARTAPPFVGPDQAALTEMLAEQEAQQQPPPRPVANQPAPIRA